MVSIQIIVRVVLNDVWHTVLSYYMRNESLNTSHMCIMKEEVVLDMSLNLVILIIFTFFLHIFCVRFFFHIFIGPILPTLCVP